MPKERLMKRMKRWANEERLFSVDADLPSFIESVSDDINKLLNTQRSTVLISESYGLNDFKSYFNGYGGIAEAPLEQMIMESLQVNEPRLSNLQIVREEKNEPGVICFILTSALRFIETDYNVKFFIKLKGDGRVEVVNEN